MPGPRADQLGGQPSPAGRRDGRHRALYAGTAYLLPPTDASRALAKDALALLTSELGVDDVRAAHGRMSNDAFFTRIDVGGPSAATTLPNASHDSFVTGKMSVGAFDLGMAGDPSIHGLPTWDFTVRWQGTFELAAGEEATLVARAIDSTGALQPEPFSLAQPDGAAEGAKRLFGDVASLAQGPAEGHIVRNQIVDVHSRPSRLKSLTVRKAARSTLA